MTGSMNRTPTVIVGAQFIEPAFPGSMNRTPTVIVGAQFIEPAFPGSMNRTPTVIVGAQFIEPAFPGSMNRTPTSTKSNYYVCLEILRSIPTPISEKTREDPPYERKGRVMPLVGRQAVTILIFKTAWKVITKVIPAASKFPN